MKVAVGYVRVSTLEQASEGVSLDAQRDKICAYCKFNGIKLIDITADEGVSGGTLERPGLQEALRMLKRGRANTPDISAGVSHDAKVDASADISRCGRDITATDGVISSRDQRDITPSDSLASPFGRC